MDWIELARQSPAMLGLLLLVRVVWRLPAFLVAGTELMRSVNRLAREGLGSVRTVTAAAQLGHQYLQSALKERGIEPESKSPYDSDEMAILRAAAEGDLKKAAEALDRVEPEDSMPLHLAKHLGEAMRLLKEKRQADAPIPRKRERSGLTKLWRTGS